MKVIHTPYGDLYIRLPVCTYRYQCIHTSTSASYIYQCVHTSTSVYVHLPVCTYIYQCVHRYTSVYIDIPVCTYIYQCIHTSSAACSPRRRSSIAEMSVTSIPASCTNIFMTLRFPYCAATARTLCPFELSSEVPLGSFTQHMHGPTSQRIRSVFPPCAAQCTG